MGSFSIWHWLIVLAVVLILWGGNGKISRLMGDLGRGIKSFKSGLKEDEKVAAQPTVDPSPAVAQPRLDESKPTYSGTAQG